VRLWLLACRVGCCASCTRQRCHCPKLVRASLHLLPVLARHQHHSIILNAGLFGVLDTAATYASSCTLARLRLRLGAAGAVTLRCAGPAVATQQRLTTTVCQLCEHVFSLYSRRGRRQVAWWAAQMPGHAPTALLAAFILFSTAALAFAAVDAAAELGEVRSAAVGSLPAAKRGGVHSPREYDATAGQ